MALALATSTSFAQRTLEIVGNQSVYELALRDVIMPNGAAGTTVFKLCPSCDPIGLAVNANTRYAIAGRELAMPDFLAAVEELRAATEGAAGVGVFYDLNTNRVMRIAVYPPH
jgi:hypothetical protein